METQKTKNRNRRALIKISNKGEILSRINRTQKSPEKRWR